MTRIHPAVPLVATCLFGAAGCAETYRDEAFGVLELESTYEGGTRTDPTAGLPTQIPAQGGFESGARAEFYDFGPIPTIRSASTGEPTVARVQPMYFFFRSDGAPLTSEPALETRDSTEHMVGGRGVLNPNPVDYCAAAGADPVACAAANLAEKQKPYAIRRRERLVDPRRGVADYQRPIIDVSPADRTSARPLYTGLWEIVEITVPDDYGPDDVKHWKTLKRALDAGDFKQRATGKVINCPVVDERSYVPSGVTRRDVPHPLIELWYRRKLAFCYLANGWESLGNDVRQLYFSNSDAERIDTFDVARLAVGEGKSATTTLVVPVERAYVPAISVDSVGNPLETTTYVTDNIVARGRPRHTRADPPGYTPIRWMWDMRVTADFQVDKVTSVDDLENPLDLIDPVVALPRRPLLVKNLPMRGMAVPCGFGTQTPKIKKPDPFTGREADLCGVKVPNPNDPANDLVSGKGDPVCAPLGLECNTRTCYCDSPAVGYGQICGPGVARCGREPDDFNKNGYQCFPPWGGFCYLGCDARDKNTLARQNEGKKPEVFVDSRCKELPGYLCLAYREGICVKFCDQNIVEEDLRIAQCSAVTTVANQSRDLGEGQICQDWGITICSWPDNYVPK